MAFSIAHNLSDKERTTDILTNDVYNFDSLLLSTTISKGLREAGFYRPSPIQLKAIPIGKCGLDLIVKSKSGTGKTMVFTILALENVDISRNVLQVVIVAPTREIAVQIEDVIKIIGKHLNGLNTASFIGGLPLTDDLAKTKNCHIAVGAPGRLKHLIKENHINLNAVRLFILDEADKLLDNSFHSDINYIYHKLPQHKQVVAVSASYLNELDKFLERYMHSPTFVTLETDIPVPLGLKQFVSIIITKRSVTQQLNIKTEELLRLLSKIPFTQCLIFSNYQQRAESLSNILNQKGWNSQYISGAQSQADRLNTVNSLKALEYRVFLCTNLIARGIDASNVDLVINYDVPNDTATYLHRMGRAGRYGTRGICVTIANDGPELQKLQNILGDIRGTEFSIYKLPTDDKLLNDIWSCELNSLEYFYGIISANADATKSDIKKSPSDVQEHMEKGHEQLNQIIENDSKSVLFNQELKQNSECVTVTVEHQMNSKNSKIDTNALLMGLAAGDNIQIGNNKDDLNRNNNEMKSESLITCKNVALFNVTKMLLDSTEELDANEVKSIDHYLTLQNFANKETETSVIDNADTFMSEQIIEGVEEDQLSYIQTENCDGDIELTTENCEQNKLNNPALLYPWIPIQESILSKPQHGISLLQSSHDEDCAQAFATDRSYSKRKMSEIGENVNAENSLESRNSETNILKLGYNFITKDEIDWRLAITNTNNKNDNSKYKNNARTYKTSKSFDNSEIHPKTSNQDLAISYPKNNTTYIDHEYGTYFDHYSQLLVGSVNKFQDVQSFHNWFEEWQLQMHTVRDFVQQNIYLQEMNYYYQTQNQK